MYFNITFKALTPHCEGRVPVNIWPEAYPWKPLGLLIDRVDELWVARKACIQICGTGFLHA